MDPNENFRLTRVVEKRKKKAREKRLFPGQGKLPNLAKEKEKSERKKKLEREHEKVSNWFVTVNSHQNADKLDPLRKRQFKSEQVRIMVRTFDERLNEFIKFIDKDNPPDPKKIKWSRVYLKNEKQKYNPSHQQHIHGLFSMGHHTKIQLDYKKLKKIIREEYANSPVFSSLPSGGGEGGLVPHVDIEMASQSGLAEREYMEKGTHTLWRRKDVAEYYKNLRETGVQDKELWNRFERTGEYFINPPEGFIPGSMALEQV